MNANTQTKTNRGVQIRKDLRLAIYLRDEFRCVYCNANLHGADPMDITLDHIKCHVAGGTNAPSNLITACRHCNCSRKDIPIAQYADLSTRKTIRRQTRRDIKKYRKLAKALIEGE